MELISPQLEELQLHSKYHPEIYGQLWSTIMISVHQEGKMDLPDSLLPSLGDVSKPAQPVLLRSPQWRRARLTMQPWAAATTRVLLKRHIIQLRINNCHVAVGFIQLRTRRFALSPAFKQFLASFPFPLQGYFRNDFSLPLWRQARFLIIWMFFAWPVGALHVLWVPQKHPRGQEQQTPTGRKAAFPSWPLPGSSESFQEIPQLGSRQQTQWWDKSQLALPAF